jgi:hypothetical protein
MLRLQGGEMDCAVAVETAADRKNLESDMAFWSFNWQAHSTDENMKRKRTK